MRIPGRLADFRLILLITAAVILLPVFARPSISTTEPVRKYLFVVDITQSMNVRDYMLAGHPTDRLNFVKTALIRSVAGLPCGSSVGLGIFTAWQAAIFFDPVELCHHRREINEVIRNIDWRMAWAPQSNVARGVEDALRAARRQRASLVFFTDGNEAPPQDIKSAVALRHAPRDKPRGVLMGVGDVRASAIPLFNQTGQMAGYFQRGGQPYLSSLNQNYLRRLGGRVGLQYHRLRTSSRLLELLRSDRYAGARPARREIGWVFGAAALALLVLVYVIKPPRSN